MPPIPGPRDNGGTAAKKPLASGEASLTAYRRAKPEKIIFRTALYNKLPFCIVADFQVVCYAKYVRQAVGVDVHGVAVA